MKKTALILFLIIVLFASIHVYLFLDDMTEITGAHSVENTDLNPGFEEDNINLKQNQTEEDPYRFL